MQKQINYFFNADIGFDKEAVLIAPLPDAAESKLEVLKSNLLKYPEIKKISFETSSPMADWRVGNENKLSDHGKGFIQGQFENYR